MSKHHAHRLSEHSQRDRRRHNHWRAVIFVCSFWIVVLVGSMGLLQPQQDHRLTSFPVFTFDAALWEYPNAVSQYVHDNFGFQAQLVNYNDRQEEEEK